MTKLTNLLKREPIVILAALNAVLVLAVGFGLDVTKEQLTLIETAAAAILALIGRANVTPV